MAVTRDYYDILEISKNATKAEIKSAYKRLAREHHPDVAKNKDEAEKRFKEINEAYRVLSDPEKRRMYDQFGHASTANSAGASGFNPFSGASRESQGGSWGPFTYTYSSSGGNEGFDFGDVGDPMDIFEQVFGFRGFGGSRRPRKGKSLYYSITIPFEESIRGIEKTIEVQGKKLKVKIPAGSRDGTEIRFTGEGESGSPGSPAGDLFLQIRVKEHPRLVRQGADIVSVEEISIVQAALGDTITVESIDLNSLTGTKGIKLKIPAGTQPGTTFRLRGRGVKRLRGYGTGDHYVQVKVKVPTKLSWKQKKLLKEFNN